MKNQKRDKLVEILSEHWDMKPEDTEIEINAKNFLIGGLYAAANLYNEIDLDNDQFTLIVLSMLEAVNIPPEELETQDNEKEWIQIALQKQQEAIMLTEETSPEIH